MRNLSLRLGILVVACLATSSASAQWTGERSAKNSVNAELLGPGIWYSVNYERLVIDEIGVRLGFSYMQVSASSGTSSSKAKYLTIPITASYIGVSNGKHSLELGGGATVLYASASSQGGGFVARGSGAGAAGSIFAGYRIQPPDGGFQFRVGVNALIAKGLGFDADDPSKIGVLPLPYLSFGGSF